jgi:acyl-CoA thioester hydrolase
VRSWVLRLGRTSLTMRQELHQDGEVAIRLDAVCVVLDPATGRPRPLTDEERAYWASWSADGATAAGAAPSCST